MLYCLENAERRSQMKVNKLLHSVFGTTPGKGMQPKEAIAYSITGFGQNLICNIIGSYLMVFMTDALLFDIDSKVGAVSGVVAVAYLMLFTRIYDALNDPIMGSLVDRTRTKWGKCRPYLKWMAFPIAIMTTLCFLPVYDNTAKSLLAPEESPLGSEQIEGRDLYTIHCLTAKQSIYGSLPRSLPVLVPQSCPTLCDPTDCRPPASSVCGILQARIQEWVAMPCSRGSSRRRD